MTLASCGSGSPRSTDEIKWPFHPKLRELINAARDDRFTWREIAQALGEGTTDADIRRVREKQEWRNRVYEEGTS